MPPLRNVSKNTPPNFLNTPIIQLITTYLGPKKLLQFFKTYNINRALKFTYHNNCTYEFPLTLFPNIIITRVHFNYANGKSYSKEIYHFKSQLHNLKYVNFTKCDDFKLHNLFNLFNNIQYLRISSSHTIKTLNFLTHLNKLRCIILVNSGSLCDISDVKYCKNLRTFVLHSNCPNYYVISINNLKLCRNLKYLVLTNFVEIRDIFCLRFCTNLRFVMLSNNNIDMICFANHKKLHTLVLFNCSLSTVKNLELCNSLIHIELDYCRELQIFFNNPICKQLKKLVLINCGEIINTNFLINFNDLELLDVESCYALKIIGIHETSKLKILKLRYCGNVEFLKNNSKLINVKNIGYNMKHIKCEGCIHYKYYYSNKYNKYGSFNKYYYYKKLGSPYRINF